jgi:hypothetical protein
MPSGNYMDDQMDSRFGTLRCAIGNGEANEEGRQQWEVDMKPVSTSTLSDDLGQSLLMFLKAATTNLLQTASRSLTFLWGMEADGKVKIAVEEVARINGKPAPMGFPSRRGMRKDLTLDDKLGHPCIMSTNEARIAGELYLDQASSSDGRLVWRINAQSGRFHEPPERRPSPDQLINVAQIFASAIGDTVEIARTRDFPPFNPSMGG